MSSPRCRRSPGNATGPLPGGRLAVALASVIVAATFVGIPASAMADAVQPGSGVGPTVEPIASHSADPTSDQAAPPSSPSEPEPTSTPELEPTSPIEPDPTSPIEPDPTPTIEPDPTPTPTPTTDATPAPTTTPTVAPTVAPTGPTSAGTGRSSPAAAQRIAAASYVERHAATVLAAQSRLDTAHAELGRAALAYSSATAYYERAVSRADLVRALRDKASTTADASRRALAVRVRGLTRELRSGGLSTLFDDRARGGLLLQLGTRDAPSKIMMNLAEMRERVTVDIAREQALTEQAATAQAAVTQGPVEETRTALAAAQATAAQATAALAALTLSTTTPSYLRESHVISVSDTDRLSAQGWTKPAVGRITDSFGLRTSHPVAGVGDFHRGTDIGSECEAAIYAATDGVVEVAGPLGTYGNWILLGHANGIETGYAHIADGETLVTVGEAVLAGQVIGGVGDTGATTGCHLHFEVRVDGTAVDAAPFLEKRGVTLGR